MHQNFDGARDLFPKALAENKLMEYLGGFPGYGLIDPYADSPTDPSAAFEPIRHLIIDDEALREKVFDALSKLAKDKEYGWMAIYYLHSLRIFEDAKKMEQIVPKLVMDIADGLRKNKASLSLNRKWVGVEYKDGLWGDVRRMNKILSEKYNLNVLPEEL